MTDAAIARTLEDLNELVDQAPAADRDLALQVLDEPYPCETCQNVRVCARLRLSCKAFAWYVRHAYGEDWRDAPREPARALWEALFGVVPRPADEPDATPAAESRAPAPAVEEEPLAIARMFRRYDAPRRPRPPLEESRTFAAIATLRARRHPSDAQRLASIGVQSADNAGVKTFPLAGRRSGARK